MGNSSTKSVSPASCEVIATAAATAANSVSLGLDTDKNEFSHHTKVSGQRRFQNPWHSFRENVFSDFVTCFTRDFQKVMSVNVDSLPTAKPDWNRIKQPCADTIQITWIGHSSCLVQFDSINVLTDPIFSKRCSPVQWAGPKRLVPAGVAATDLPQIDAVIISHNHYDHLDCNTVRSIRDKVRMWFVPLGIKQWLVREGVHDSQVTELDWWQEKTLATTDTVDEKEKIVRIVCTPCQHLSGRGVTDRNSTLWASWTLIGPTKRFFFCGDSGYRSVSRESTEEMFQKGDVSVCPAFEEVGQKFGPFDLAALPIGAYSPRWFMSPFHCSPEDAVAMHIDIKSRQSVGIHWGTFNLLTDEPVLEPPLLVKKELDKRGLRSEEFVVLAHGQTREFSK